MDKNFIRRYAIWARRELIERVAQRAMIYGVSPDDCADPNAVSVNNRLLSNTEKKQRQDLIRNVKKKGYANVVEEVAYTWFNRFAALRFMEVNGYLPSHVRVFTNDAGEFKPQILSEAVHLDLDGLDKGKVFQLLNANKSEELFKYLLILQCNALSKILPGMFQPIEDYTELLLPDYLLRDGSAIQQMIALIPEDDWTDQVQIIGWLYQYYNSELKDKVFADLKKNVKISKENIPAATQLFTPDWIVHYMVENSLGRLWLEGKPNDPLKLKSEWKYYLDEPAQEESVQLQLEKIRADFATLKPEDIRVIDPCMGSGHILCVLFDVLVQIYKDYGYSPGEAAVMIVENNLWGLDIDDRAAQLAYFAVMMKARSYHRQFFKLNVKPNVFAIQESNSISKDFFRLSKNAQAALNHLVDAFANAKNFGSIIQLAHFDYRALQNELSNSINAGNLFAPEILHLVRQAIALSQNYHVVVTNPPYMGSSGMGNTLAAFVKKNFPDSKSDLSTVFMERCRALTTSGGFYSMINIPVWMFISSYEKLRRKLIAENLFVNMAHNGRGIFGSDFGTTAFVLENISVKNYTGNFRRLFDAQVEVKPPAVREKQFLSGKGEHCAKQDNFSKIPGAPVAYWVSEKICKIFDEESLCNRYDIKAGISTGNNENFIFYWYEIDWTRCKLFNHDDYKYTPHNKGGEYRKWYGNRDVVLKYNSAALSAMEKNAGFRHDGKDYYFKEHIGWSKVTSGVSSFRLFESGFTFDSAGLGLFPKGDEDIYTTLAFLNSKIAAELIALLNPTLNVTPMVVKKLPFTDKHIKISELSKENISLSRADWDAFETSWDFKEHPIIRSGALTIRRGYEEWEKEARERFERVKANEEELNRIFIEIYGLGGELKAAVEDKEITVRRGEFEREVRSFLSYAVGCMFGRYALGRSGIIYAGGEWNLENYPRFKPNKHEVIPISDAEYFEDDIIRRLEEFLTAAFGAESLEENLQQIAFGLGKTGAAREGIRNYFMNEFYGDHVKIYKKRPIYWQFDSGKKNGFKCLVYLHRYRRDTIARIRTDYVHEQQARYRTAIEGLEQGLSVATSGERVKISKQLTALRGQAEELRLYEEKIHHLADQMITLDLDDGVKHNYEKFGDVLAKLK